MTPRSRILPTTSSTDERAELRRLQKENQVLKEKREKAAAIFVIAFFSACTESQEPVEDKVLASPAIECTRDSDCGGDVFVGIPTCRKRPAPSLMQYCSECDADDECPVDMYCVHKVFCALKTSNPKPDSSNTEDVGSDSSDDVE